MYAHISLSLSPTLLLEKSVLVIGARCNVDVQEENLRTPLFKAAGVSVRVGGRVAVLRVPLNLFIKRPTSLSQACPLEAGRASDALCFLARLPGRV